MSDTPAFIPDDPTKRDLLEAQVSIAWRRVRRYLQALGDTVAVVAGERPQSTAELIVLAAEALGERPEVIAELTPAELANRLQRAAARPGPAPKPVKEAVAAKGDRLTPTEARVWTLFAEAAAALAGPDGETTPEIKQAYDWLVARGLYDGELGAFYKALSRARRKQKQLSSYGRSAAPLSHFYGR